MQDKKKVYLLFDGDCGICAAFADWARRLDGKRKFEIVSYQDFSDSELQRAGLTRQKCEQRMYALTPRGMRYGGAWALNYFFWQFMPYALLVAMIYALPLLLLVEIGVYALVAKHRRRISQWLGLQACASSVISQKP